MLELIGDNHEVEIAPGHDVEVAGTWDFTTMNKDFSIIIKGDARLAFTTQNANILLLPSQNLIVENTSKEDALIQTRSIDIVRVTVVDKQYNGGDLGDMIASGGLWNQFLAVEFGQVVPVTKETHIALYWETLFEPENCMFEIFISNDAENFENCKVIKAREHSIGHHYYVFNYKPASSGVFYFKVRQLNKYGQSTESKIVGAVYEITEVSEVAF